MNSYISKIINDKQEENRIGNDTIKCYKYELLFNVHGEVSEKKLNELRYRLDIEFKYFGLTELTKTEV